MKFALPTGKNAGVRINEAANTMRGISLKPGHRAKTLVAALFLALASLSAWAYGNNTLTVVMNNKTMYRIQFEFVEDRGSLAWPGGNEAYDVAPYDSETVTLNCNSGQWICYGAWVKGSGRPVWGVGNNHSNHCSKCCASCGGTVTYSLVP